MEKVLLGTEAFSFLEKEGFSVLKSVLARDAAEAARVASAIGFPVAVKISSADVVHKTEEKGVKLFVNSEDEVKAVFQEIVDRFTANHPGRRADGVVIQRMGSGLELIIGSINDTQFGPVLMFGLGGIFAEAMRDISFRLIPINERDANEMIKNLRGSTVLTNPRVGTIDLAAIQDFLLRTSRLIVEHSEIQEMDLNPVIASPGGLQICDGRIKIKTD